MLTRFWVKFDLAIKDEPPPGTLLGCGVTAQSRREALQLLQERVFRSKSLPPIRQLIEGVEISTLDSSHVQPNMGDPTQPGVWFPLGYDEHG